MPKYQVLFTRTVKYSIEIMAKKEEEVEEAFYEQVNNYSEEDWNKQEALDDHFEIEEYDRI